MTPTAFGRYELLDRVAAGGMAEVWRARLRGEGSFQRIIAIKKILPHVAEDQEFITMFQDEANITSQLQHSNIGQVYEFNRVDDCFYIAMEYISGKDLKTMWSFQRQRKQILPLELSSLIVHKMADGLDYAHHKKDNFGNDAGIVHRDVSPQNVLISWDGEVKVIDFGIAKAADKAGHTRAGTLKGKFAYMSPEQIRGMPLDGRADIFALGVVLYELVTGVRGFSAESEFSLLEMVRNVEIRPPSVVNPSLPQELERIIFKALAKDRDQRYLKGADLSEDLQRFLLMRGKPPSRHDLAKFVRDNFTVDYNNELSRLESYKDASAESVGAAAERSASMPTSRGPRGNETGISGPMRPAPRAGTTNARGPVGDDASSRAVAAAMAADAEGSNITSVPIIGSLVTSSGTGTGSGAAPRAPVRAGQEVTRTGEITAGRTPTNFASPSPETTLSPTMHPKHVRLLMAAGAAMFVLFAAVLVAAYFVARPQAAIVVSVFGPPKATVVVDGETKGVASPSITLDKLSRGTHSIIVEEPGFITYTESVEVEGGVQAIKATLRRVTGRLDVSTDPPGATIMLDGVEIPQKSPATLDVESESFHEVVFKLEGHTDLRQSGLKVAAGVQQAVRVTLQPAKIFIRVLSTPDGVMVTLDGKKLGITPVTIEREPDGSAPSVTFSRLGCTSMTTSVPFDAHKAQQRFNVTLKCK